MSADRETLRRRLPGLGDDELVRMVTVEAADYQQEAIALATEELRQRGIDPGSTPPVPPTTPAVTGSARLWTLARRVLGGLRSLRSAPEFPLTSAFGVLGVVATVLWWLDGNADWALVNSLAFGAEAWRFLTSTLAHLDLLHLGFNLCWLWVLGIRLEAVLGAWRLFVILLVLAVTSAAAEYAVFAGGVGLSGVGYGLFTISWVLSRRDQRIAGAVTRGTVQAFAGWFLLCIVATTMDVWAIGNVAHAAGAGMGALLGRALSAAAPARRWIWRLAAAACTILVLAGATVGRPSINLDPAGAAEASQRGYAALKGKEYREAVRWLRRATAYRTTVWEDWHNLSLALGQLKRYAEAVEASRRALAMAPYSQDRQEALAERLAAHAHAVFTSGDVRLAARLLKEVVRLDERRTSSWYNLSVALGRLGREQEALEAQRRARSMQAAGQQ